MDSIPTALGCIYLIICLATGKMYVGQTIHPFIDDRFDEHLYAALVRKTKTYLYNAIRKYGPDAFTIELLCAVPYESLDTMEAYWAEQLTTYIWDSPGGYNMVWCGEHGRRGIRHTEEAKAKMRKVWEENRDELLAQMRTPERRFMTGSANRGKTMSPEQREKISLACAKWWTPERRASWALEVGDRMKDDALRTKISQTCSLWWTPERREQKSQAMAAATTDADRQRSSEASLAYWSVPENRAAQSKLRLGVKRPLVDGVYAMNEQARRNISIAKKGKPRSEAMKSALKATAAERFRKLFSEHLVEWISDPIGNAQWRYGITRKKREGTLLDEYVSILEATPGWEWSTHSK
jgi:group I intron endonuclease